MPIKDLSNRQRVPRLDKIRIGIKEEGKNYPKGVDHFVCPEEVRAVYGEKPKRLKIAFHSNDMEEIFPQYYKRYGSGTGLVCKGDGELAMTLVPGKKQMQEVKCMGRECEFYKDKKCKQIGNLLFMIRGVKRFGVYQLDTGSYNTILNVNGGLDFVKGITNGTLKFVPLILEVIPQEVNPEGKKKTVYVLRIEADVEELMLSMESKKPGEILILEAPKEGIEDCLYPKDIVDSNTKNTETTGNPGKDEVKPEVVKPVIKPITKNRHQLVEDISVNRDLLNMSKEVLAERVTGKYGTNDPVKLTIEQLNEINKELEEELQKEIQDQKDMEQPEIT